MKKFIFAAICGIVCAACLVPWDAGASETASPELCKALQDYVSQVDAARSVSDTGKRKDMYREAQSKAAEKLKRLKAESLLEDCANYSVYVESIVVKDATDPALPGLIEKRVKLREKLLGLCAM
jgi:hypothetical protein